MIGQRQRQKILKNLVRRGILTGELLRGSEIRGLRRKYGVSLGDFAKWCSVSADVILKTEDAPDCYVDGGLSSQLVRLAQQFAGQQPRVEPPSVTQEPETPEPVVEPVQQAPVVEPFTEPEQATINRVAALDLTDLKTAGQKALAAVDIWVAEHRLKKLVVNPKVSSSKMRKEARWEITKILGITDRELQEAWLLYRQVEAGERCLLAIQRVRRGELRASSASADYDAHGWNPTEARRGRTSGKKAKKKKKRRKSSMSSSSITALPATTETVDAAEQVHAALGSLHLKLMKFEQDHAKDREIVKLVTAAREALDPSYQEVKRMVLRRARRKNRRTTRKDVGRTTPERERNT